MIYLKKEQNLQRIDDDCESIPELPGWKGDLSKKHDGFVDVIGYYKNCKHQIPCGLADCHTKHQNGILLSSKEGGFTHVGRDCGKNITGIDFRSLWKKMELAVVEFETREQLHSIKLKVPTLRDNCLTIKEVAGPLRISILALKHPQNGLTDPVRQAISNMNTTRNGAILVERKLSDAEYQAAQQTRQKKDGKTPRYVSEENGRLAGYTAWEEVETLRQLIASKIPGILDQLKQADPEQLSPKELKKLTKTGGELEGQLATANKILTECKRLLSATNLLQLLPLSADPTRDQRCIRSHAHSGSD